MAFVCLAHATEGVRRMDQDDLGFAYGIDEANEMIARLPAEKLIVLSSDPIVILKAYEPGDERRPFEEFLVLAGDKLEVAPPPPDEPPPPPSGEDPNPEPQRGYGPRLQRESEAVERALAAATSGGKRLFTVESRYVIERVMHNNVIAASEEEAIAHVQSLLTRPDKNTRQEIGIPGYGLGVDVNLVLLQFAHDAQQNATLEDAGWAIHPTRATEMPEEDLRGLIRLSIRRKIAEQDQAKDYVLQALAAHLD